MLPGEVLIIPTLEHSFYVRRRGNGGGGESLDSVASVRLEAVLRWLSAGLAVRDYLACVCSYVSNVTGAAAAER